MLLLAAIMIVLYLAAAGLSVIFDRRRVKRDPLLASPGSPG
jgi:sec-independent protein translocase protein TatC